MTRYETTATVPKIGKVKHVIRANDRQAAIAKIKRAHPKAQRIEVQRLKDPIGENDARLLGRGVDALAEGRAKSHASRQQRHAEALRQFLDAIPPEGAGTTQIAEAMGVASVSVRKWAAKLEAQGKVERVPGHKGYLTIRRVEA